MSMFAVSPHDPQFQEPGSLFNSWCPHGKRSQWTLAEVTGARLKVLEKLQDALKVGLALENTLFFKGTIRYVCIYDSSIRIYMHKNVD
jgi:hypothetical protein